MRNRFALAVIFAAKLLKCVAETTYCLKQVSATYRSADWFPALPQRYVKKVLPLEWGYWTADPKFQRWTCRPYSKSNFPHSSSLWLPLKPVLSSFQ